MPILSKSGLVIGLHWLAVQVQATGTRPVAHLQNERQKSHRVPHTTLSFAEYGKVWKDQALCPYYHGNVLLGRDQIQQTT